VGVEPDLVYELRMWAWFKKRAKANRELKAFAEKWLGPMALAAAIAETVRVHFEEVQAGRISFPAHRRDKSSVVQI